MKRFVAHLPVLVTALLVLAFIAHGPIAQLENYHAFADQSVWLGIPHAADVLSNLGFALIAVWGMVRLWPQHDNAALQAGRHGYGLFLIGLLLTAFGSCFYHWAPDNMRLVFDRLPIAFVCAGLLAAVRAEALSRQDSKMDVLLLGIVSIFSVGWWYVTEQQGAGDLRPYLLLQVLPIILIPMWQAIHQSPMADRLAFGAALALYIVAKFAEITDHRILAVFGFVSGHTLKHLLATVAAGILIARLIQRSRIQSNA